jgi:hypothetical protein
MQNPIPDTIKGLIQRLRNMFRLLLALLFCRLRKIC